jgi:hypothetical protein
MLVSRNNRFSGSEFSGNKFSGGKSLRLPATPSTQLSIAPATSPRPARVAAYSEGQHLQLLMLMVATLFLALVMLALALLISNPAFLSNDVTQPYDWNNWTPGQYPELLER